jgi:uncharacterized protein
MGRCKKQRCCRALRSERIFKPVAKPLVDLKIIELELDEFEAVRLCDFEDKSQIEASIIMQISRGTLQRILQSGRKKILEFLINNQALKIKRSLKENNL